ncbi:unnamed protein product [Prorocentrum cordatum]|uniref:Uncharacterized protein n=1 Tax=Prorocentrum cordatum TaxID=2364126 RepID=A0ABN9Y7H6_9DINO|nr:unnamed protein product [Polarella glacialis]
MELRLQARAAQSPPAGLQLLRADAQIAQCLQRRRADPTQIAATVQESATFAGLEVDTNTEGRRLRARCW